MLCAISGEAPQVPVASQKSGNVFEKRLIESYILENGKDPVTGEDLTLEDLVELKTPRIVRPRPPTLTSIPSLLSVFQNEWDAMALETYNLQQSLKQTRQELSTALYQHDAAIRVIARLSRERDEARDALSRITINGGTEANGEAMQVDKQELSSEFVAKVEATQERLSKTRRKRMIPDGWITSDTITNFRTKTTTPPLYNGARNISLDTSGDLALLGGTDGAAGVFSISKENLVHELKIGSHAVISAIWVGRRAAVATSSGSVKIFEDGTEVSSFNSHAGEVTSLAVHPSEDILASVGVDKTFILYDLTASTRVIQVQTDSSLTSAAFHPDGHLFAAGGMDGQIKLYDVKSGANAANFIETGPIQALSFSENGTWLAAVSSVSTMVSIWDLRKSAQIKVLDVGSQIEYLRWDYTGQFLATVGRTGIAIHQYSKPTKEWSEPLRSAVPAIAVEWGPKGQSLIALGLNGAITIIGQE